MLLPTNPFAIVSRTLMLEVFCPFKWEISNRLMQVNSLTQLCFIDWISCLMRSQLSGSLMMDSALLYFFCKSLDWISMEWNRLATSEINKKGIQSYKKNHTIFHPDWKLWFCNFCPTNHAVKPWYHLIFLTVTLFVLLGANVKIKDTWQ